MLRKNLPFCAHYSQLTDNNMKTKVQYQHTHCPYSGRLYRFNSKGQFWLWSALNKKWMRSCSDNQLPLDYNITKEQAKKLYPEAFKVKLP